MKQNLKTGILKGIIGSNDIIKGVYKVGDFYRNIRNLGIIYKYYGNFGVSISSLNQLHEILSRYKLQFPLNFQIIIKHTGGILGKKEYFLSFWYGFSSGMNIISQVKNEELQIMYQKLNSIKSELQQLEILSGTTEIEPEFIFFKKEGLTNGSKIKNGIFKEKKISYEEFKEWETLMFQKNILKILKEKGITEENYSSFINNDYFSKGMSFGQRSIQEKNYEKILGFYFGDDEIYYPYTIAGEPFMSGGEYIMSFDLMKFIDYIDSKFIGKLFDDYSISINLTPTDIITHKDKYKIPGKSVSYKYNGVGNINKFWLLNFFLNIFTREPDITPFVQGVNNEFSKIRIELTKENIDGNEGFLTRNQGFIPGSDWYGTNNNIRKIFGIMKPYIKENERGVKMGVDFFSNNPFKINIFDYIGKNPADGSLNGSCSTLLVGPSGSGKTFFAKNYYKQNKVDQLFVLDNMGNFQQLKSEDRGLVLKYGYDIASLIGEITPTLVTIEKYLFYKKPEYREGFKEILIKKILERTKLDDYELDIYKKEIDLVCERFEKGEITEEKSKEYTSFNDIEVVFNSLIRSKIKRVIETLYILNNMKEKRYDSKLQKFVIEDKVSKEEMESYSIPFVNELFLFLSEEKNKNKEFLIEDFKKYIITKKKNGNLSEDLYNKIYNFIKDEVDFPNLIGNIDKDTITMKIEILKDILYSGKEYSTTESTRMDGIIKNYFVNKDFFLFDDFYEYLKNIKKYEDGSNVDKDIKLNLINHASNIDEKTKSILNRKKSFIEDYLSSGRYQKIIISNEYILNDITDWNVKGSLTAAILNSYLNYISGVKRGKYNNPFGYSTIMIDEFHNYNNENDKKRIIISRIEKLIREVRNNNSSVFLISQSYDDFNEKIKDNCYYKIFVEKGEWQKHKQEVMESGSNLEKIRFQELEEGENIHQKRVIEIEKEEQRGNTLPIEMSYKKRFLVISIKKDNILTPYLLYPKFD